MVCMNKEEESLIMKGGTEGVREYISLWHIPDLSVHGLKDQDFYIGPRERIISGLVVAQYTVSPSAVHCTIILTDKRSCSGFAFCIPANMDL